MTDTTSDAVVPAASPNDQIIALLNEIAVTLHQMHAIMNMVIITEQRPYTSCAIQTSDWTTR